MAESGKKRYNVNVGVLGHVDSGKTSLVAALSTHLSTAALDKHPQSKERGITLDLGFSAFTCPVPVGHEALECQELQITLIDCPGHASLVRTIIGGAQIMDMMLLVIDVTKGIQAQTAECLVVGELTTDKMVVVLNKIDLLPEANREKLIAKAGKMLLKTFALTKFESPAIVALSARSEKEGHTDAIDKLIQKLMQLIPKQPRQPSGNFLMSVDHCFAIRGHGTVMTGTVLQGAAKVNDMVEIPQLKEQRKIKSMQMFKTPQQNCSQGDRVGICITQLDPSRMERGWLCKPGAVQTFSTAIARVEKIKFYVGEIKSKQNLHITVGHSTVLADVQFFGLPDELLANRLEQDLDFDISRQYQYQDFLYGPEGRPSARFTDDKNKTYHGPQWCLLQFKQPVTGPKDAVIIGSRLDSISTGQACRLALHGKILMGSETAEDFGGILKVFKVRRKEGQVEKISSDGRTAICKGLFKKESDPSAFMGMKVVSQGRTGILQGKFGVSGKIKVCFVEGLKSPTAENSLLTLEFKKLVFSKDRSAIFQ